MEVVDNKVLVIKTTRPDEITAKIKKSKILQQQGGVAQIAVYWGLKEAQDLVSLRIKGVPSTIQRDYTWPGRYTPFAHQKDTASFLTLNKRAYCFNEQGTGKTASVIWAADYLMKKGLVRRVLVLCPLSIMKSAWQQDLFKFAIHRSCSVAHGDAKQRKKIIEAGAEFVIINFDGLAVVKEEIMEGGFDLIVVDEANAYKNAQTNRWKVLRDVTKDVPWVWMLTGTPAAQSPLDAYGLYKLIDPTKEPRYFGGFRAMTMYKASHFKWKPKPEADRVVHSVLQPAIRFEKKDCLDLPDVVYVDRDAPLTVQQKKFYDLLRKQMQITAAGESVSAVNAATNINKLLQISGGAVYSDNKEIIEFDVSNRINTVLEVIEESSHKVLVFVPFTHTIELLRTVLEKNKITCDVINGKVSANKRSDIVKNFQDNPEPRVLIIQPQAASHGLTLTAANTVIWYAPVTSVETYLQANARINRPGQKNEMTVVHIKGSPVEERLYKMLRSNIADHEKIIDLYRSFVSSDS